jgi:hypothetical protein
MNRRRFSSPESLGLTLHSKKRPNPRAAERVERLKSAPLGDYRWRELAEEFQVFLDLFPYSPTNLPCRHCHHFRTTVTNFGGKPAVVWVHIPHPMKGDRRCQPDDVPCNCPGYEPEEPKDLTVAKAAYAVRQAARKAYRGKSLPRWNSLRKHMVTVFRFVSPRMN